jgi:hypothetical protein
MRGRIVPTIVLAVLLSAAGCNEEPAPVKAAKAFAVAAQGNNVEALLELVDARTVAFLQQSAERASDQIGGRRSVESEEMLQIVDVDRRFMVAKAELVTQTEDTAQVRLVGADGTEHVLELVLEDESWRVRIPLPPEAIGAQGIPATES